MEPFHGCFFGCVACVTGVSLIFCIFFIFCTLNKCCICALYQYFKQTLDILEFTELPLFLIFFLISEFFILSRFLPVFIFCVFIFSSVSISCNLL